MTHVQKGTDKEAAQADTANAIPSRGGVSAGTRGRETAVLVLEHLSKKKFTM